ncbi:MAG: mechanosensitive ion channel family protein [Chitinophagales bacterium]|nr:mechanosensitive ion channel family protein [Chitinophagales bacterium]
MNKIIDSIQSFDISTIWHNILIIVLIIIAAIILNKILRVFLKTYFENRSILLNTDPTTYKFLRNAVSAIVFSIATFLIFYSIPQLKTLGLTLFASAGIFAAILGFAAQEAFANIISGIFIVIFKPFKVGDVIKMPNDIFGTVEDINLRHTTIKSFESRRFIVPNSTMASDVILNSSISDERTCQFIELGISYDSDIDKAREILTDLIVSHPLNIDARTEEEIQNGAPRVRLKVINLNDFSIDLRAWAWAKDHVDGMELRFDILEGAAKRFPEEGIEIPFPYRTIVYKNDL